MRPKHFIVGLALATGLALPYARAQCLSHPTALAAMRDCYRVLLVFSANGDPRLHTQLAQLQAGEHGFRERDLLVVPVLDKPAALLASGLPIAILTPSQAAIARHRFQAGGSFSVVLLGKDGSEKFTSRQPLPSPRFFRLIDSMPMRQQEMKIPR